MKAGGVFILTLASLLTSHGGAVLPCYAYSSPRPQTQGPTASGQSAIAKSIGTIKVINGNAITLAPASGPEVAVTVQPTARLLRLASGDKDLKNASTIQVQDLQVGDTIRVRGLASDDGKSMAALEVIVITHAAVAAVSDQMRQDWQKRGLGGVVNSVDAAGGTVTITVPGFGEKKTVAVRTSKSTVIRRYAPESANFEAAKPSNLAEIHVNDQLRARGDRSADGSQFDAAEIVTGTFPYVEGTIKSVDASAGTLSVQDVLSKRIVQLRITADSQLHKVPPEMAQRMAFMLKAAKSQGLPGTPASTSAASAPAAATGNPPGVQSGSLGGKAASGTNGSTGGSRPGGGSGFQRMLDQTPAVTLADLHKGDALTILATEGARSGEGTVIKLFSGVEPILEAAPNASQAMMLTPWSLGGAPNGDAANP